MVKFRRSEKSALFRCFGNRHFPNGHFVKRSACCLDNLEPHGFLAERATSRPYVRKVSPDWPIKAFGKFNESLSLDCGSSMIGPTDVRKEAFL